jgi:hypothetical protein
MLSNLSRTTQHISENSESQRTQSYRGNRAVSILSFIFHNWRFIASFKLMAISHLRSLWFNMLPQTAVGEERNSHLWLLSTCIYSHYCHNPY